MSAPGRAVDRYLNEVCWAMGGRFAEQQAARDELQAHIRDAVADLQRQGVAAGDAVARALRDLGDPQDVGRSLRESRGRAPLRRAVAQPAGAVLLGRRDELHLPNALVLLALAAMLAIFAALLLAWLWPG
jgi:uncharacterized membrane protein